MSAIAPRSRSRLRSRLVALASTLALAAGLGLAVTTPAHADVSSQMNECNKGVAGYDATGNRGTIVTTVAAACIAAAIEAGRIDNEDRGEFVQSLTTLLSTESDGAFNVMIFNTIEVPYTEYLHGVVYYAPKITYTDPTTNDNAYYTVWIFQNGGTFTNQGDGGWLNWGMSGYFTTSTKMRTWSCERTWCQHLDHVVTFTPAPAVNGHYLVSHALGTMCVDNYQAGTGNGNPVVLWTCDSSSATRFYAIGYAQSGTDASSDGPTMLVVNGKCLDDPGDSATNGTMVDIWQCVDGATSEQWIVESDGTVRNAANGQCLAMDGNTPYNGDRLIMWNCVGQANEAWHWVQAYN